MTTRTRAQKRGELDLAALSKVEKLLVAQAVFELGPDAWADVAKLLAKHPLVNRPKNYYTTQSCNSIYVHLMEEAGFDITRETSAPKSRVHKQLAEQLWKDRYDELKALIIAEEESFMTKSREIDEIRAGKWDDALQRGDSTTQDSLTLPETLADDAHVTIDSEPIATTPPACSQSTERAAHSLDADATQNTPAHSVNEAHQSSLHIHETSDAEKTTSVAKDTLTTLDQHHVSKSDDVVPAATNIGATMPPPSDDLAVEAVEEVKVESPDSESSQTEDEEGSSRENTPLAELVRRDGKRKESPVVDSPRDSKRPRDDSEPMDEDDDDDGSRRRGPRGTVNKQFVNLITGLHTSIRDHRSGAIFHQPVKKSDAPDYGDVVRRPIDLKTIKARLRDGQITNSLEYHRDIALMFANAMMYNRPSSDVYQMAEAMRNDVEKMIEDFRQTEGIIQRGR